MNNNNQFFAVFGSGGSSSGGSGVSGSGTNNYVTKWTPDGSTIGDSIIQDNGSEIGLNCSPDVFNGVRIEVPNTETWTNGLMLYKFNGTTGSDNALIHSLSVNSNSSTSREVAILGQVNPTTFTNSVQYVGVKGILGLVNTSNHLGEHCGVLGSSDQSGKDVKGVVGTIANGKSAIGVYGYLIDGVTNSADNFTGVQGTANIDNTSVSGSAYGVVGSVTIADVTNLPTNNAGGSFGATMSANADAGTYTMTALQSTGVTTTAFAGVLQTAYSLKVGANTETFGTITNKYGIYQEGADDLNFFNANTGIGVAPNDDVKLNVAKTTVGSVATYGLYLENNSTNSNAGANGINYGMYVNSENDGTGSAYGIYSRINNGSSDATNISSLSNVTNNITNLQGITHQATVSAELNNLYDIRIISSSGAGTVDNHYAVYSSGTGITNTNNSYHIYLEAHTFGGVKWGVYQDGSTDLNYFGAKMGIAVTPQTSEAILTVQDTRTSSDCFPAIYGYNSSVTVGATGVHGAVGNSVAPNSIQQPTEGMVGVFGEVQNTDSTGSDYGTYGYINSSSNNILGLYGARGRVLYSGTTTNRNIYGGYFDSSVSGASAQVLNAFGIDVDSFTVNTATIGAHYGIRVQLRSQSGTPSITNAYGLYVDVSNINYSSGVSTLYGIRQVGSSAINYFQGNVGIGTDPAVELHVKGNQAIIRLETQASSGANYLEFYDPTERKGYIGYGSSDDRFIILNDEHDASMNFWTTNSGGTSLKAVDIDGDQNVEISAGNLSVASGQMWSQQGTTITVSANASTFDGDNGNAQKLDLASATADITLTFTNLKAGGTYFIPVIQKSSSPYNIGTYVISGGTVKFPSGTAPTISTGSSAIDTLVVYYDGTDCLVNFSQNYS